ncbi:LOW QUALITY PROTEIN: cysteine and histidine-rich domain-containing protein RAR1 [Phalaenopsis equestris]|uniref:LOW QUALITY PROTEIN: cysteine and histidine-rich domain-containing protein RAR1 n=1 Tax=Phalaenopsis equestris TaxID=78828 RepID=UPI0009E18B13|nr:LOW QUALITY PROTEIN: cysteine and histidine-rich domain-containing protein RAR1 [Phalaenopsis equestris]
MEKGGSVRCQRIGCDATFSEDNNEDGSCRYHDSEPIFHDGMKEWSCCKQRSHDFSLFLAIPGCKSGKHTTEKPVTKAVSTNTRKPTPTPIQSKSTEDAAGCSRCRQGFFCSDHGKYASFRSKSGISKPAIPTQSKDEPLASILVKKIIDINEPQTCRHKGCGKTFKEKDNHETACEYHPGPPVFHDRMRGWKCCDIHVKEFDEFMNIPPCTKGWHNADV